MRSAVLVLIFILLGAGALGCTEGFAQGPRSASLLSAWSMGTSEVF